MAKQNLALALFYDGVWNEHDTDVLTRDQVEITHGRDDESGQPAPAKATFSFNSWDFNPRNPASPLFGKIGRNTPIRITQPTLTRFVGEVSSWTPRQSLGGPDQPPDRWVQVVAAGGSRRLGQGADPLNDAMRREVEDLAGSDLVGYWPLDDVDGSTSARAVLRGGPMRLSTEPELASFQFLPAFGAGALHPWLPPGIETRENGSLEARVTGATPGDFSVNFVYRATRASDGNIPLTMLVNAVTTGPQNFQVLLDPGLLPRIQVIDSDGGTLGVVEGDPRPEIFDGLPHLFRLRVIESSGNNVGVFLDLDGDQVIAAFVDIEQASLDPLGKVVLFWQAAGIGVLPVRLGQVIAWNTPPTNMVDAFRGRSGEPAGVRIERLCDEEGVPFVPVPFDADLDDTQPCGPQYPDGFLTLLREAADLDHGILTDSRPVLNRALAYRTGRSLYNQPPILSGLDYAADQVAPPLDPVLDDQATRNDITVQRRDGDSFRATLDVGPMSTQTPPDGVGRVQESVTVNTMSDGLLGDQAGWRLHLGTADAIRFPQVTIDLDANPELATLASVLAPGDRLTITNLPAELSPDPVTLLVQGYTETIGSHRRKLVFNCSPEEPYHIAEVEHADYGVVQSDSATLNLDRDTDTTVMQIIANGYPWVYEADFDILVGGERMTVTAVPVGTGDFPNRLQNITVVRSVNGVVKAHALGTPVEFFHKAYIGL